MEVSPTLTLTNTPHPMATQYIRQQTSTYYSQRFSTTGFCRYNSFVYPPYQQKLHETASTNITLSSSISCSYSAPIIIARNLLLTTTATLRTVFPPLITRTLPLTTTPNSLY